MLRAAAAACAALVLASCATAPAPPAAAAAQTVERGDYTVLYQLKGETASLLAEGRLDPPDAVALDKKLDLAKAELDAGYPADARLLIDAAKTQLTEKSKP